MERVLGLVVLVIMITSDYGSIANCFRRMAVGGSRSESEDGRKGWA